MDAALALARLDQDRRRLGSDRGAQRVEVAERHVVEALEGRVESLQVLGLAAGGDGRQRAAVERAPAGDDAVALALAGLVEVLAHQLDAALDRLGARVAEERAIGEAIRDEPLGQPLLPGDPVQIRGVPQLSGLLGQRPPTLSTGGNGDYGLSL